MINNEMLVLMARASVVSEFAIETAVKIDEYQQYMELGILGHELANTLLVDIESRITEATIERNCIMEAIEALGLQLSD